MTTLFTFLRAAPIGGIENEATGGTHRFWFGCSPRSSGVGPEGIDRQHNARALRQGQVMLQVMLQARASYARDGDMIRWVRVQSSLIKQSG